MLFIYSQIKTEIDYQEIATSFSANLEKIPRNEVHRVLGDLQEFEFFNTGMQSRTPEKGETYRIQAGSNVASSISPITGKMFSAGHVFCKAQNSDEKEITIGYSSGSKIWSSTYLLIPDYIKWCDYNGRKIANNSLVVKTGTNYDTLPMPKRLLEYPDKILFVFFSDKTYASPPIILAEDNKLTEFLLTDASIEIFRQQGQSLQLKISCECFGDTMSCDTQGMYNCLEPTILIKNGKKCLTLVDYLNSCPLIFKATNGAIITRNEIFESNPDISVFPPNNVMSIDWNKFQTDIACEFGKVANNKKSIHDTILEILFDDDGNDFLLYDHGTGEIADFITIKKNETNIDIGFYHIKAMRGKNYNENVGDIYEVCQQAIKSLIWLKSRSFLLSKIKQRQQSNHCIIKKGTIDNVEQALKENRLLSAQIYIVQPAIQKAAIYPEKFQEILASASNYVENSGMKFSIWGS